MSITVDKIASLLRQAEGKGVTEAEAAAFMETAQRLATKASIDLSVARAHQANKEKRETPIQKRIHTGEKGKHGIGEFANLALAIAAANDIECNIARDSTYIIAFGFPSDIEVLEALFASLMYQMEAACSAYVKSDERKKDTVEKWDENTWSYVRKPVHGSIARKNFQTHFVYEISYRLLTARNEAKAEVLTAAAEAGENSSDSSSTAMVLVSKEVEVQDFKKATSTARGTWKGAGSSKGYSASAASAGRSAGRSANLGGQKELGGSRTSIHS